MSPQTAQQCRELVESEQQRLSTMENDREPCLLASGLLDQPLADGLRHVAAHALGLKAPSSVRPLVDVAVGAVDVAPAGGLDENRVQPAGGVHAEVERRTAIDLDCAGCGHGHSGLRRASRSAPPPSDGRGRGASRRETGDLRARPIAGRCHG